MLNHLAYVLWHDIWKPWLLDRLRDLAYILLGVGAAGAVVIGIIWFTIELERAIGG